MIYENGLMIVVRASLNAKRVRLLAYGGGSCGHSERVVMSERALRRCVFLHGSIGATDQVDQVYAAYYKQMRSISAKAWEPISATLADLQAAKEGTSAYKFPIQGAVDDVSAPIESTA